MIRIQRDSNEPPALSATRATKLPELQKKLDAGEKPAEADFQGYGSPEVKEALYRAQHRKCAYCEKPVEKENEDVEHFRPKKRANRIPGSRERHGYWWLTFSWENLLFACRQCNTKKGFKFPLRPESHVLSPPPPPSSPIPDQSRIEWPLLLHPIRDQGLFHIEFRREVYGARSMWRPTCREGSARGAYTIRVLRLDREGLLEWYERHFKTLVEPHLSPIRQALGRRDKRALWNAFHKARFNLFARDQPFIALAYDAARTLVPNEELASVDKRLQWPSPDEIPVPLRRER